MSTDSATITVSLTADRSIELAPFLFEYMAHEWGWSEGISSIEAPATLTQVSNPMFQFIMREDVWKHVQPTLNVFNVKRIRVADVHALWKKEKAEIRFGLLTPMAMWLNASKLLVNSYVVPILVRRTISAPCAYTALVAPRAKKPPPFLSVPESVKTQQAAWAMSEHPSLIGL
jgi:hypothetical protein